MTGKILKYLGIALILLSSFWIVREVYINDFEDNTSRSEVISYAISLENRFSDVRMNLTLKEDNFEPKVILAAITDDDLRKIGRWPFDRNVWADFLNRMHALGAKLVAFDVFFYEPAGKDDLLLAQAIKNFQHLENPERRVVLAYKVEQWVEEKDKVNGKIHLHPTSVPRLEEIPNEITFLNNVTGSDNVALKSYYIDSTNYIRVPEIMESEPALSFLGAKEDPDGVFRNYHLVAFLDGSEERALVPSFALRAYQVYKNNNLKVDYDSNNGIHIIDFTEDKWSIPLDVTGGTKVRWFGRSENFPSISINQILHNQDDQKFEDTNIRNKKYDPAIFKDAAVFVGSVAYGAHDLRHSPVDAQLPGVYHHMNMFKQLLDKNTVKPLQESKMFTYIFLFVGTLSMVGVMLFGHAILDVLVMLGLSGGLFYLDTYHLLPAGYEIKLVSILVAIIGSYSWSTFLHFYQTSKEKSKIRGTFKSFVSPAIVEKMLANPDMVKVGGEKRNITVMFSDVRDFTTISEKLTPDQLAQLLNRYMGIMTDILFKHGGTLDKYIGDAIVAFWGAPLDLDNHPYHALKAGIEMIEALPPLNEQFAKEGLPILKHGIGFNTGDCSVGNMGSSRIFQYTALGDNMNLGARLEGLCKPYGVQIICSEFTKNSIPENLQVEFKFRLLDKVKVKGKDKAVTIYEVLHHSHPWMKNLDALNSWETSFDLYLKRNFQEAKIILIKLCQEYPDDINCIRLLEACEEYINHPPNETWEGVTKFTTK